MNSRHVILPDLGLDDQPIALSMWLVKEGQRVAQGDPVVEVLAGSVTVDLPAPADGILIEKLVADGESLAVGQRLAVIEEETGGRIHAGRTLSNAHSRADRSATRCRDTADKCADYITTSSL